MKIGILCGGKGCRLRPQIEEIPKTLVPLNGKPILEHNLELFYKKNHKQFILCIGYKGEKIIDHVKKLRKSKADYNIIFSNSGVEASMLERVYKLKSHFKDMLLITYGDTLTNIDVDDLKKKHLEYGKALTIVITKIRNPFGLVDFNENNEVLSFSEKPLLNYYIGMFILNHSVFNYIDKKMLSEPDGVGLVNLFNKLIGQNQLMAYQYAGDQITFNTYTELEIAEEQLKSFYTF